MLGVFSALEISASGLGAERVRMNTIASNLANVHTTKTAEGGPYKRLDPVFEAVGLQSINEPYSADSGVALVNVKSIQADTRPGTMVYEPGNPDANGQGYVEYPNVNAVEEMVNMITASRAYEAGVSSVEATQKMADSALALGRG
jgi:flagellar basal-body rod protein FlgC